MSSQRLTDFLALGTSGDRPVSLDLPATCVGFRWETDTGAFVWDGAAWVNFAGLVRTSILATETHTSNYTVLAGDNGKHFNINGASGNVIFSLPAAVVNMNFGLLVSAAHYAEFLANGTDVIWRFADTSAAGGYIRSNIRRSFLKVECHESGVWAVSSEIGAWSIDE